MEVMKNDFLCKYNGVLTGQKLANFELHSLLGRSFLLEEGL